MRIEIHNDHTSDYVEELDGEVITIPARSFLVMPYGKGKKLVKAYTPPIQDTRRAAFSV